MLTSMNPQNLRSLIQQTLQPLSLWTPDVEELLMATASNESNLGEFRTQAPHGPARGIFQDEAEDFNDLWTNYLVYHSSLANSIKALNNGNQGTADDLVNNDPFAIAVCRAHYLRAPGSIPAANDIEGIWTYYKAHYNTPQGAATHDQFIQKYKKFVLGINS
jgi:hypothetical protein